MRDAGVSETVGTVLLVALVVVLAGAVYLFVGYNSGSAQAPAAVGLSKEGDSSGGTQSFLLASVARPTHWNEIQVLLDGKTLTYDGTGALPLSYCVIVSGTSCTSTLAWDATTTLAAGQHLVLHDTTLAGKTLTLVEPTENAALLQYHLG